MIINAKLEEILDNEGHVIPFDKVLRIESIHSLTCIILHNYEVLHCDISIDDFEWQLPSEYFKRIHPNHLINRCYSRKTIQQETNFVEMYNGDKLPISPDLSSIKDVLPPTNNWFKKVYQKIKWLN